MRIGILSSICLLMAVPAALAKPDNTAEQRVLLLEQLRTGQALYRDDMIENALRRLALLAPQDADVVLAGIELSLRRGDMEQARADLQRLTQDGDNPRLLRQAQAMVNAHEGEGRALRQQAQLLAASGQPEQAMELYRQLWGDEPPGLNLGLEHWRTLASVDGQRPQAMARLQQLDARYPGNPELRLLLARLWLAEDKPQPALALLGELAGNPTAANRAAELEYNYLVELPVSAQSEALWQRFLSRYEGSSYEAGGRRQWQQQRALLQDPAWQDGQRGIALAQQGRYHSALPRLRRALQGYPQDAALHGAHGQTLIQLERYAEAEAALGRAVRLEQDGRVIAKWQELHRYAQSLVWHDRGRQALARQEPDRARGAFEQARQLRPGDVLPLLGLADVALTQGHWAEAEQRLEQARKLAPNDARVVYALTDFYRQTSPKRALAVLESLPAGVRREYNDLENRLRLERLAQEIEQARTGGRTHDAIALLRKSIQIAPPQPWKAYELATLLWQQGDTEEATAVFPPLLRSHGDDPQVRHAHAQFLASYDNDEAALSSLRHISPDAWSDGMRELFVRLEGSLRREKATQLREQGHHERALALLTQSGTVEDHLLQAGWLMEDGKYRQALALYEQLSREHPDNTEAWLGVAESRLALQQPGAARQWLQEHSLPNDASVNQRRRYINLLVGSGQSRQAEQLMAGLLDEAPTDPLLLRDAARLQPVPNRALLLYGRGLAATGELAPDALAPLDGAALTQASRERAEDDWLQRSLKREAADLYRRQNATLQVQHDLGWRTDNNPEGVNDLSLNTTMVRAEWPWVNGRAWVQAEHIRLNTGSPAADDRFGACNAVGNCATGSLDTSGSALALGWQGEAWSWDLGHTPQGFEVSNWLGGLSYAGDWRDIGYSITLSRRPMSNSLVSYAGAVDPVTGLSWGGVTATGLTLGLSRDQGGKDGVWASLGAHQLEGERVDNNRRFSAMTGYYYRLTDTPNEQLRVGASLLYFHYQKDLSEDTLGQGGYYSPQHYLSVGLPLRYGQRSGRWSTTLEASPSWSWSRSEGNDLYPGQWSAIADSGKPLLAGAARRSDDDSNSGPGLSLAARGEYRLNERWILGGGLNWQVSEDYAPGHGFLYLRYYLQPWLGDLDFPVEPLAPYAEWR
ncbi:cellulose synthase complex outer membrane protein BcsC [Oceanimonas doudoroffii]|uniref:Cellulose biosynthesis protein BcsC n=1 Tax=Oceanimonas doudoroffii TaxID=84158 RepID=A0A233RJ59_9GAMM|nr:cellulose synthase complex outer membrane protein BcsC [Oceanimonas doudoroffii]OXY83411.1 cellulose biosynthesis protein BcsC [Oceanimonas doudoroffii]